MQWLTKSRRVNNKVCGGVSFEKIKITGWISGNFNFNRCLAQCESSSDDSIFNVIL